MDLRAVVDRVERRLTAVGKSAAAASREAGLTEDAIRNMKRALEAGGRRGVSTATISALAPVLKTSVAWLLEGTGSEDTAEARTVPVVGYVGAGAAVDFIHAENQGPFDYVEAPDNATPDTVAAEIRGESLGSLFNEWLVFYDEVRSPVTPDMYGKLCVVGLPDGRVLVKQLKRAPEGRFHLISNIEGPMLDQEVAWAAKVKDMRPR